MTTYLTEEVSAQDYVANHPDSFFVELCEDCIAYDSGSDLGGYTPDAEPMTKLRDHIISFTYRDAECADEPDHGFAWGDCDGCATIYGGNRYTCVASPR